jgi:hypothetical protein
MATRHGLWRTHDEPSMLHAFCADQPVRQLLDISRRTAKYDYLQAALVVEVRVQGGNDYFVTFVLEVGKLLRQQASVMVVNERDRSHDQRICGDYYRANEAVTNQIAKGF